MHAPRTAAPPVHAARAAPAAPALRRLAVTEDPGQVRFDLTRVPVFPPGAASSGDGGAPPGADAPRGDGSGRAACPSEPPVGRDGQAVVRRSPGRPPRHGGSAAPAPHTPPAAQPWVRPITRTLSIFTVIVGHARRNPGPDIAEANRIWARCNLAVQSVGTEDWPEMVLDRQYPFGLLNVGLGYDVTDEELALLSHRPGGNAVVHVYYVRRLGTGILGKAFIRAFQPFLPQAAIVSDVAHLSTLAHELGHILLDHDHIEGWNNLMAENRNPNGNVLDDRECARLDLLHPRAPAAAPPPANAGARRPRTGR